ncbi:MAG: hypothetical protein PHG80_00985 [Methanoregulaceae archaeon]|nr:hypothetical protein [Methanoregulaceae archaeon]
MGVELQEDAGGGGGIFAFPLPIPAHGTCRPVFPATRRRPDALAWFSLS